jgi:O-antigen/teichoic acid export membrane protein
MKALKDAKWVSSAVLMSAILASVRSIILLRLLGPVLIGAWKTALLVDTLGEVCRSGVLRGMSIRVPVLSGQGKHSEADKNAATAGGFLFWLGVVSCLIILGASFFVVNPNVRLSLRYLAIGVGIGHPYFFLRELAGARHQFGLRATETIVRAVIDATVAILLCRSLGITGLGLAMVLALVVTGIIMILRQNVPFRFTVPRALLVDLMRAGIPFSLTEAGYQMLRRVDVLLIALFLGPTQVGFYGISILIMDCAVVLSEKGVSQVLSPHLLKEFGRTGSHSEVATFYEMPARLFCYVLPPVLAVGTFALGPFVHTFLPQYTVGVPAAQITLWCMLFVVLHFSVHSFFVASNMVPRIIKLQAITLCVAAALQAACLTLGYGILGAAWCTLVITAAWSTIELFVARTSCGYSVTESLGFILTIYTPFMACFALRYLIDVVPLDATHPFSPMIRASVLLLCYLPLFFVYENKFSMIRTVRQAI